MYIKKVIISGFKTYKNKTEIDNFSPHHNVVIGFNGSGKSNFFAAIRFVLSDDYTNLKREERRSLIYQGTSSVMSGYVEIIFQDFENRTLLGPGAQGRDDIIRIRRTVGLKKDEYMINNKNAGRSDVQRLLESAGFSTSNPYNIVPQGRIVSLTNAEDSERLQLLEEVVGAKSFERKLKDSLQKMVTTEKNREKIKVELQEVEDKLNELDEERRELEKYNGLDRSRKMLQYALHDRELNEVTASIEKLEGDYDNTLVQSEQYIDELDKREALINNLGKNMHEIVSELKMKESTDLQQEREAGRDVAKALADVLVRYEELQSQRAAITEQSETTKDTLKKLRLQITSKEEQLKKVLPRFDELTNSEMELKSRLRTMQQRQRDMISKRGNYAKFKTKEERDYWISKEIATLEVEKEALNTSQTAFSQEREQLQSELAVVDQQIEELNDSICGPGITAELADLQKQIMDLKKEHLSKIDERKQLWRAEQKAQSISEALVEDVKRAESGLNETMSRDLATGLKNVNEIVKRLNMPEGSVFAPLGELIKVSEKYKVCAEVVGGNSLFHVVVDTEETASLIMQELYNMKGGRVTFMPLNRLEVDNNIQYPSNEEHNCTPLIKKIKYDPKFERAVAHVFRKTIVVKDLVQGSRLAKQFNLNTITLDGDKADNRGLLTGGFRDHFKLRRLDSLKDLKTKKKEQDATRAHLRELKEKVKVVEEEIDQLNNSIKKAVNKKELILSDLESLKLKLEKANGQKYLINETLSQSISKIEKTTIKQRVIEDKIQMYTSELEKPFDNQLTAEEMIELDCISAELPDLQNQLNITTEALNSVINKIDSLKAELESKLIPQERELESLSIDTDEAAIEAMDNEIEALGVQREKLLEQQKKNSEDQAAILQKIEELTKERTETERLLEKANSQQRMLVKKINNYQKGAEKSMIRKQTLTARRDELQQKIRDIGLLPEDSLDKYKHMSSGDLLQKLASVNDELSKMTNVNKRALEHFKKFDEKKRDVINRAKELDESKTSIENLIEKLKRQKVDAVENTFKKVSESFTQLFEKMVPRGTGKLVIHRRNETSPETQGRRQRKRKNNEVDESAPATQDNGNSIYSGVSIEVSFNSKSDEQLRVEQLSGGQKTVCAIALILAIQMVDPAPFYLFDEIDAALDKQYRTAVAATIKELSTEAQFICTTFRSDMIAVADRFYRVKFENKISTVVEISQENALNFVNGREKGEQTAH
ncbi:HBR419Wp [Eremothecium sinecaudum]|uniref:Structural maintenance of chromosomes protein n=1 Tax=Eremothecium sinecaudum TaxID=45286 RepID=A0A120K1F2_9SACH|nr:HBR419Wp [Eremothecium sinecaudum]AMD19320.1 HBR419Wp [Eremothecium sinecaudum]